MSIEDSLLSADESAPRDIRRVLFILNFTLLPDIPIKVLVEFYIGVFLEGKHCLATMDMFIPPPTLWLPRLLSLRLMSLLTVVLSCWNSYNKLMISELPILWFAFIRPTVFGSLPSLVTVLLLCLSKLIGLPLVERAVLDSLFYSIFICYI